MKVYFLILSAITFLCLACFKEKDPDIVSFDDTRLRFGLQKYIDTTSSGVGAFAMIFFEKTQLSDQDTLRAKFFMANNILDTLISYPLEITYAYDTISNIQTQKNWDSVYVIKDTGYLSIPIKKFDRNLYNKASFYSKINLPLKTGKDSFFTVECPLIINIK